MIQVNGRQMYIGKYFQINDLEGVKREPSYGYWTSWKTIDKWAYPKDVFPFSNDGIITLLDYSDGNSKISSGGNRELEHHQAWEASLLIADRLR